MEKNFFSLIIILCFTSPIISIEAKWREYSACQYGRLQSPIELNEYDSTYSNKFSFVYQYYKGDSSKTLNENGYTYLWTICEGNFVNFEKEGVIIH
jgi:carbonic anhydrase